jgi:hypothetical protein
LCTVKVQRPWALRLSLTSVQGQDDQRAGGEGDRVADGVAGVLDGPGDDRDQVGVGGGQVRHGGPGQVPGVSGGPRLGVVREFGIVSGGVAQAGFQGAQLGRVGQLVW